MAADYSRIFTLVVDARPTLAFEAINIQEARQISRETWLQDDLMVLTSGGSPLGSSRSKLSVRVTTAEEAMVFARIAEKSKPTEDVLLAYLVDLDPFA